MKQSTAGGRREARLESGSKSIFILTSSSSSSSSLEEPDSDALRSHIYALRNARDKPFPTPMLETLHGQGYRLVSA